MKTLSAPASYEETIRKSRFVAHAAPVRSQVQSLDVYESVADPQATHNCWAWRIDHLHRSNDDGEPSGTAGRPILAAIEGRGLEQVMVVVTRYYGGIKLGVGGLVRAYGGCASKCLDRAEIIEWQPRVECTVRLEFALSASAHELMGRFEARKLGEAFDADGLQLRISLPRDQYAPFGKALADLSRGQAVLKRAN